MYYSHIKEYIVTQSIVRPPSRNGIRHDCLSKVAARLVYIRTISKIRPRMSPAARLWTPAMLRSSLSKGVEMGKKLGGLIRTARTNAGFTQAQLAQRLAGVSAQDVGRYERGEAEPTTQVVKEIAKACGVTQKSLLDAMPKTGSGTSSSSGSTMKVTATERRLVEAYRSATTENRKLALQVLKGESSNMDVMLSNIGSMIGDTILKK